MTSPTPPRDWTDIHWPDIASGRPHRAGSRCCRWRRPSSTARICLLGTDVMIGEAYLARVRELLPATLPVTFLPLQPVGISTEHIDYPGTLTLSDRDRAERAGWRSAKASRAPASRSS